MVVRIGIHDYEIKYVPESWGIQENLDILDETEEKLVNTLGKGLIQVMRQMCFHDIVEDLKSTGG